MTFLAQVPDSTAATSKLIETGVLGAIVVILFGYIFWMQIRQDSRDKARDTREDTRQKGLDDRELSREEAWNKQIDTLVKAISEHDRERDRKSDTLLGAISDLTLSYMAGLLRGKDAKALPDLAREDFEELERRVRARSGH